MPYRKPYGNLGPDYCAQIFIPNGDVADKSLWYRTSLQNTWNEWKRSCDDGNADTLDGLHADSFALKTDIPTSLPVNGGTADTARQVTSPSSKVKLYEDHEGGNLELVAPDGVHAMQMDLYNNEGFRMYFYDGSQLYFPVEYNFNTGKFNINGNADTLDGMHASDFMPINGEVRKYGSIRMNGSDGIRTRHIDGNDEIDGALYLNYNSPDAPIYMNGGNTAIHSGNIGSQSVNYANSAGNADTVDGMHGWNLMTLTADGNIHGASFPMYCKHNVLGDNRFYIGVSGGYERSVAVGYAENAGTATNASNADTLDGYHAGSFATANHTHDYAPSNHVHRVYGNSFSDPLSFLNTWTSTSGDNISNAPVSGAAWFEVYTGGISNRLFQIAASCYSHNNGLFIRFQHDGNYTSWTRLSSCVTGTYSGTGGDLTVSLGVTPNFVIAGLPYNGGNAYILQVTNGGFVVPAVVCKNGFVYHYCAII